MPQFDYGNGTGQPVYRNGQIADGGPRAIDSGINELLAQANSIAVGGTTDGTYTVRIIGEEGTFDVSFVASTNTADEIADGLAAAVLADAALTNIVSAAATSGTPLLLDFVHPGRDYDILFPSNPGTNMVNTLSQAAGGTAIGLGVAVQTGSGDNLVAVVDSGTTDAEIAGITVLNVGVQFNDGNDGGLDGTDQFEAGVTVSAMRQGRCVVVVETAVAKDDPVFARIQNAAAGVPLGQLRNTADGGNTVALTGAKFHTAAAAGGLAVVTLNRP